jgi:protein-tyrosine phosphatase
MVCMGNICRSPMAEAVARAMIAEAGLSSQVTVESYGTSAYHVGERADSQATAALRRRGWTADGHRARQLRPESLAALDLLLCADHGNLGQVTRMAEGCGSSARIELLRAYDPMSAPGDDEVPDPWGRPDRAFDESLTMIERACVALVAQLAEPGR